MKMKPIKTRRVGRNRSGDIGVWTAPEHRRGCGVSGVYVSVFAPEREANEVLREVRAHDANDGYRRGFGVHIEIPGDFLLDPYMTI